MFEFKVKDLEKARKIVSALNLPEEFGCDDGEFDTFGISSRRTILFIPQIPEIEKYLRSALDSFFEAHRELLLDVKEQKRMKRKQVSYASAPVFYNKQIITIVHVQLFGNISEKEYL